MINLTKQQSISLTKNTTNESVQQGLDIINLGVDWGMIKKGGVFGFGTSMESVDLDASVIVYDQNKKVIDKVYYSNKTSKDGCIKHSGDDRGGDSVQDDKDNEVIVCGLSKMNPNAKYLALVLNSFSGQDFGVIPYVKARVYTGNPNLPTEVLGAFNIANESNFKNKTSMILGVLSYDVMWSFKAIGEPSNAKNVDSLGEDAKRFL